MTTEPLTFKVDIKTEKVRQQSTARGHNEIMTRRLRTVRRKILTVTASDGNKVKWALPADLPKAGLTEMIEKAKEKLIAEAGKREEHHES